MENLFDGKKRKSTHNMNVELEEDEEERDNQELEDIIYMPINAMDEDILDLFDEKVEKEKIDRKR